MNKKEILLKTSELVTKVMKIYCSLTNFRITEF